MWWLPLLSTAPSLPPDSNLRPFLLPTPSPILGIMGRSPKEPSNLDETTASAVAPQSLGRSGLAKSLYLCF